MYKDHLVVSVVCCVVTGKDVAGEAVVLRGWARPGQDTPLPEGQGFCPQLPW